MALSDATIEQALRALAEALEAGLSLRGYLEDRGTSRVLPGVMRAGLLEGLTSGTTVTTAFARLDLLTDAELALVQAGEKAGRLAQTLVAVADGLKDKRGRRWKIILGLGYPALLIGAASCVLPLPMIVKEGVGAYLMVSVWAPILMFLFMIFLAFVVPRLGPRSPLRSLPARLGMALPLVGGVLRRSAHGAFAQALGQCIDAGLSMPISLQAAVNASGDPRLIARMDRLLDAVEEGATLTEALEAAGVFHDRVLASVAQGEATGTLVEALEKIAERERKAFQRAMGVFVGIVVVLSIALVFVALAAGIIHSAMGYIETIDQAVQENR